MDIYQLATTLTVFLAPFLPYLISASEGAAKEIGKKFGKVAWTKAQSLWSKLLGYAQNDPQLNGALVILASDPEDENFQVTLAKIILKKIESSSQFAAEARRLMGEDKVILSAIVDRESEVKSIYHSLSRSGTSSVVVKDKSRVDNIRQEVK